MGLLSAVSAAVSRSLAGLSAPWCRQHGDQHHTRRPSSQRELEKKETVGKLSKQQRASRMMYNCNLALQQVLKLPCFIKGNTPPSPVPNK